MGQIQSRKKKLFRPRAQNFSSPLLSLPNFHFRSLSLDNILSRSHPLCYIYKISFHLKLDSTSFFFFVFFFVFVFSLPNLMTSSNCCWLRQSENFIFPKNWNLKSFVCFSCSIKFRDYFHSYRCWLLILLLSKFFFRSSQLLLASGWPFARLTTVLLNE